MAMWQPLEYIIAITLMRNCPLSKKGYVVKAIINDSGGVIFLLLEP